jgi:hypothetical protein
VERLDARLYAVLLDAAQSAGLTLQGDDLETKFTMLIKEIHIRSGERVVVIIDEYDKPLLSTIDDRDIHKKMRDALKGFYGVLKSADEHLRFVFLTGVTKFSKVSIFSDLNNLTDISMDPSYCDICGITQEELERDFSPEIEGIAQGKGITQDEYLAKLKHFYNGYRFSRKPLTVYNPFGLLNHFNSGGQFDTFWFATGTPTFLIKLIQAQKINVLNLERNKVSVADFHKFDVDNMEAVPVLYQSGYLTIVDYNERRNQYTLDYPNEEVRISFAESLCDSWTGVRSSERTSVINTILDAVEAGNVDAFVEALKPFYNGIPYELIAQVEYYYELVFYLVLRMLGLYCFVEVRTAVGRIDAVLECDDFVYVLEFKVDGTAKKALQQIDDKDYALSWNGRGKKIFKIGIVFDKEKRNIGSYKYRLWEDKIL